MEMAISNIAAEQAMSRLDTTLISRVSIYFVYQLLVSVYASTQYSTLESGTSQNGLPSLSMVQYFGAARASKSTSAMSSSASAGISSSTMPQGKRLLPYVITFDMNLFILLADADAKEVAKRH